MKSQTLRNAWAAAARGVSNLAFYKGSFSDTQLTSLTRLLSLFSINIGVVAETDSLLAP